MSVPYASDEIRTKIVLCGPPQSGKASFLRHLVRALAGAGEARLSDLRTDEDRVLALDALPSDLPLVGGRKVRLGVYCATGDVRRETTLRNLVAGADALLFLADTRAERAPENAAALRALRRALELEGVDEAATPAVVAFNRRHDAPATSVADMERTLNATGLPAFDVDADLGRGVVAAFAATARLVFEAAGRGLGDAAARRLGALRV